MVTETAEKTVTKRVTRKSKGPKKSTAPRAGHVDKIEVGSKEHAAMLAIGYQMTPEEAEQIIRERNENPGMWSWEDYKKAKAMLKVLESPQVVTATRSGWKRQKH